MNTDFVSVITPCYNAAPFIAETIASVSSQTYRNIEHIVIDDGSTDSSWKKIVSYGSHIKAFRLEHRGGCYARNYGAQISKGNYLLFLDADDLLRNDTVESLVTTLNHKSFAVATCPWKRLLKIDGSWQLASNEMSATPPNNDPVLGWITGWYIPPCSILWSRKAFESTGGWDETLAANQDGDIMLRALIAKIQIIYGSKGETSYRHHGMSRISVSSEKSRSTLLSRMKVLKKIVYLLEEEGIFSHYAEAIGQAYYRLARHGFSIDSDLAKECLRLSKTMAPDKAATGGWLHLGVSRLVGLENKERIANALAALGIVKRQRKKSLILHDSKH